MKPLDGKRVVVTGGASGIGRASCRRLAEAGAQVLVLDRDAAGARAVADEIGGLHTAVDVTDSDALTAALLDAHNELMGIDVLFNNAGGLPTLKDLHEWEIAEWQSAIELNLTAVFVGMKVVAPLMLAAGSGTIINTASVSGLKPGPGEAPYSAAKAAVAALSAGAALEYGPTIRVNSIAPGFIRTGITEILLVDESMGFGQWAIDKTPLARVGSAEEVADVVVFLAGDGARFITGQNIVIDGGVTLHGSGIDGLLQRVRELRPEMSEA